MSRLKAVAMMMKLVSALVVVCAPGFVTAQAPPVLAELPANVKVIKDLEFAQYEGYRLVLDLYRPIEVSGKLPAIVVISEGGWEHASRALNAPLAARLAERGFVVVSIDYRGASEATFPASVHDAKAAVRWLRANAETYGVDSDSIGAIGGSWGGFLSSYVGVTGGITQLEGEGGSEGYSSALNAVVGLSTPTDVTAFADRMERYIGVPYQNDPALWKFASPVSHINAQSPPLLLIASQTDNTVPFQQSVEMARRYAEAGLAVELVLIPKAGHTFWYTSDLFEQTLNRVAAFFHAHLD